MNSPSTIAHPGEDNNERLEAVNYLDTPDSKARRLAMQESGNAHRQEVSDEEMVRSKEAVMAKLETEILISGMKLDEAELVALKDAVLELIDFDDPEAGRQITDFLQRLNKHVAEASDLREKGFPGDANNLTVKFLTSELRTIEKIPNKNTRDKIVTLLGFAIDMENLEREIKIMAAKTAGAAIAAFLPGGGVIDLIEASKGRTVAGEKIGTFGRTAKATMGTVSVAASIATLGSSNFITGLLKSDTVVKGTSAIKEIDAVQKLIKMMSAIKHSKAAIKGVDAAAKVVVLMQEHERIVGAVYLASKFAYNKRKYYRAAKASVGIVGTRGEMIKSSGKIDKATAEVGIRQHLKSKKELGKSQAGANSPN